MIGLSEIYSELRDDRAPQFEDNSADPNIFSICTMLTFPPINTKQSRDIFGRRDRQYPGRRYEVRIFIEFIIRHSAPDAAGKSK